MEMGFWPSLSTLLTLKLIGTVHRSPPAAFQLATASELIPKD